jgi:macrolide-specific efflux system membrane fusion protein
VTRSEVRRRSGWLLGGIVAIAVAAGLAWGDQRTASADAAWVVAVKRGTLTVDIVETGRVEARERVELKSKVAGEVTKVLAEPGAHVQKGQRLIVLDPTDYQREAERAEADIARAAATYDFSRRALKRTADNVRAHVIAAADLDAAEHQQRTAEAELRSARVSLRVAQDRVRYTQISAPIDGTVIQRGIEVGEVVTPGVEATFEGKPLLTIADLSKLRLQIDLNQIDVAKIRPGQRASVTFDALPGRTYAAEITQIAPASVRRDKKDVDVFPVEAELLGLDQDIKPGMTADVRIHLDNKPDVLMLPIEAVVDASAGGWSVTQIVTESDGAESRRRVAVTLGASNDRESEVLSGLTEGDRVLLDPASAAPNELEL